MVILRKRNRITSKIYNVLLAKGFQDSYILQITQQQHTLTVTLQLPNHREIADLLEILPNMQQELSAMDHKVSETAGKRITILFGMYKLESITFNQSFIHPNTLKIQLPSAFGSSYLDFEDGASCHLLNGGTTRMGKTTLLLYLSTVLYIQSKGKISLYITSTKLKDFYPFHDIVGCHLSRTEAELKGTLDSIIQEYKTRDQLLYSPSFSKATDAKSVRKHYLDKYHLFEPIFLLIDEYARFADNKEIQKKLIEIVETAGYVNIHVIISTQRPDARTVLPPRIKSNLLARICFTTTDKNNSRIILDQEGAESLGKIEGRAIFLDSETNIIQVPYLSTEEAYKLLAPYKKESISNEQITKEVHPRPINPQLANKIQNLFEEPTSSNDFQTQFEPNQRMQPSNEATSNGWYRLASTENKGSNVSIHSESITHPPQKQQNQPPIKDSRLLHSARVPGKIYH